MDEGVGGLGQQGLLQGAGGAGIGLAAGHGRLHNREEEVARAA